MVVSLRFSMHVIFHVCVRYARPETLMQFDLRDRVFFGRGILLLVRIAF